jgi:hypothetical protein
MQEVFEISTKHGKKNWSIKKSPRRLLDSVDLRWNDYCLKESQGSAGSVLIACNSTNELAQYHCVAKKKY